MARTDEKAKVNVVYTTAHNVKRCTFSQPVGNGEKFKDFWDQIRIIQMEINEGDYKNGRYEEGTRTG